MVRESDRPEPADPRPRPAVYEIEQPVARPALPGEVVVLPTRDQVIDRLAADLVVHAENCVREFGDFHLALSGDATFESLFLRLMYDPNYRRLPWRRTHLWLAHERCVEFDDERSCCRLVSESIGDHADIPPEQFHPIFAGAETPDSDYEAQLRETLAWREKGQDRLDYVLLALDADGGSPALAAPDEDASRLVSVVAAPDGARSAVALTPVFINAARFIAVYAIGDDVARPVERLAADATAALPARALAPINGELRWYLDHAACGADRTT